MILAELPGSKEPTKKHAHLAKCLVHEGGTGLTPEESGMKGEMARIRYDSHEAESAKLLWSKDP